MTLVPSTASALEAGVTSGSATTLADALVTSKTPGTAKYSYVSNVATWIAQGASPTASAGAGSMYVPANVVVILDGAYGAELSVIADASSGKASLTPVSTVP